MSYTSEYWTRYLTAVNILQNILHQWIFLRIAFTCEYNSKWWIQLKMPISRGCLKQDCNLCSPNICFAQVLDNSAPIRDGRVQPKGGSSRWVTHSSVALRLASLFQIHAHLWACSVPSEFCPVLILCILSLCLLCVRRWVQMSSVRERGGWICGQRVSREGWGMARGIGRAGVCGQEGRSVDGWTGGRVGGNI